MFKGASFGARRLILETDPTTIAGRVAMRGPDAATMSITEQARFTTLHRCCRAALLIALGEVCSHQGVPVLTLSCSLRVQTFSKALATAKEQIARSLLK